MNSMEVLMKGALLHDIGKICMRADRSLGNHSQAGAGFVQRFMGASAEEAQILRCIKYHHKKQLASAKLLPDDLSYIVYEADNIAAAMDRRADEEGRSNSFDATLPLSNIFNVFGGSSARRSAQGVFRLRGMDPKQEFNYPEAGSVVASSDKYQELVDELVSNFQRASLGEMSQNELLRIMEDVAVYVPSSTNRNEQADISLFTHVKVTAAVAACMKQWFDEQGIKNYRRECLEHTDELRQKKLYLLISGDISGIQDFIYTIPSKGALKSLRGRSVYLELLMENFIDELLAALGLSRANLLYSGGGHFYLLAGATEANRSKLAEFGAAVNHWLLDKFGTQLYLAWGSTECDGEALRQSAEQNSIFRAVSEQIAAQKLNRYGATELEELFDTNSAYNSLLSGSRECGICHSSSTQLTSYGDEGALVCPVCASLFKLGERVLKEDGHFVVTAVEGENAVPIYGNNGTLFLHVVPEKGLESFAKQQEIVRIYTKNGAQTGSSIATRLWLADYAARRDGEIMTFEELARVSCGEQSGIKRLGVLRADVDNLGAAFISGFIDNSKPVPEHFATFSRHADLSRYLLLFFKLAVDKICRGETDGLPNDIFAVGKQRKQERGVSIVYSGGDDVFIVGAWDELLEVALDIRKAFARFTENKLSFSAGLALFNDSSPVRMMAELTGRLEDEAKHAPGKDSIALFGFETEQGAADVSLQCEHVYKWDTFLNKVCLEKLRFLQEHLGFNGEKDKLPAGKTMLYRFLELLRENRKGESMNLARFAYTLARMQPRSENEKLMSVFQDFEKKMFNWCKNKDDAGELITAITLLVYYLRQGEEA